MGADGCPVLNEGRVKPDVVSLPEDQPGPPFAMAVSRDNGRDSIEPHSMGIGVGGSRKHLRKIADVLARGPGCEPLGPSGVQLLELDAPVVQSPVADGLGTKHFHPVRRPPSAARPRSFIEATWNSLVKTISTIPGTVSTRAQSRCSSPASDTQLIGCAPACVTRSSPAR